VCACARLACESTRACVVLCVCSYAVACERERACVSCCVCVRMLLYLCARACARALCVCRVLEESFRAVFRLALVCVWRERGRKGGRVVHQMPSPTPSDISDVITNPFLIISLARSALYPPSLSLLMAKARMVEQLVKFKERHGHAHPLEVIF
jgi:hypothetical protein